MKTTVSVYDFRQAFHDYGRGNQFSYQGLEVLYEGLESLAEDTGEEIELDVIALCCEFAEGTAEEIAQDYNHELEGDDEEEKQNNLLDWLHDQTFVCGVTDNETIVYQQF